MSCRECNTTGKHEAAGDDDVRAWPERSGQDCHTCYAGKRWPPVSYSMGDDPEESQQAQHQHQASEKARR